MNNSVSRRTCLKGIGAGAAMMISRLNVCAAESKLPDLAIDRSNVDWGERPMYLRPYHPTYLVYYYGARFELKNPKWIPLIERIENESDLVIRFIEAYDDACANCPSLKQDRLGSVWGVGYSCPPAKKPDSVADVTRTNRRILGELGLFFGSEILMRDLVPLLAKNVPVLYDHIGGTKNQEFYEKGLKDLTLKYGL